jgi:hypothetical protein
MGSGQPKRFQFRNIYSVMAASVNAIVYVAGPFPRSISAFFRAQAVVVVDKKMTLGQRATSKAL